MTFVIGLSVFSLIVVAGVGFFVGLSSGANAQCGDCLDHEAERAKQAGELRDLSAANGTLSKALAYWMGRAQTAEQRVQELWMEHCESNARAERSLEIISERAKLIDEAKAKCGPDFPHVAGTERDPIYLTRADIKQDDIAWVATIDELCGGALSEGEQT